MSSPFAGPVEERIAVSVQETLPHKGIVSGSSVAWMLSRGRGAAGDLTCSFDEDV